MRASEGTERVRVVYPAGCRDRALLAFTRFPATLVTRPGAALYGWAARTVRRGRLRARHSPSDGPRVISIGNLEVGGNGKTPFAILVIQLLEAAGHRPAYVSRGFGSVAERLDPVTLSLPPGGAGDGPLPSGVRLVRDSRGFAAAVGDEGAMLAMRCPRTPLVFSRDRGRAVDVATRWVGATHVVLDDAFQTWTLHRDLDIVLVDGREPFGNGRLIPAGTLREEPAALARAGLVGANGVGDVDSLRSTGEQVRAAAGRDVPLFGLRRSLVFVDSESEPMAPRGRCASLSSIARPQGFDRLLSDAGVDVALSIRYPDHYPYGPADASRIRKVLTGAGISVLVTTEKDWVKLRELELPCGCVIARLELDVVGADLLPIIEKPQASPAASDH